MFAIRSGQDGEGSFHEILPARWEQNRIKLMVMISICLIVFKIGRFRRTRDISSFGRYYKKWGRLWRKFTPDFTDIHS